MITLIASVKAAGMPNDVLDYCLEQDISTHYQNDIAYINNDGNPFATWLRTQGYEFDSKDGEWIGIFAT